MKAENIKSQLSAQMCLRREDLISYLHTLKILMRRGLLIRSHNDCDSSIILIDLDKSQTDFDLQTLIRENEYLSHEALEE